MRNWHLECHRRLCSWGFLKWLFVWCMTLHWQQRERGPWGDTLTSDILTTTVKCLTPCQFLQKWSVYQGYCNASQGQFRENSSWCFPGFIQTNEASCWAGTGHSQGWRKMLLPVHAEQSRTTITPIFFSWIIESLAILIIAEIWVEKYKEITTRVTS